MEKQPLTSQVSESPASTESTAPIKIRENWREFSQEMRHSAENLADRVESRARNAYTRSRQWAKENPRMAVGIGGLVGAAAIGGLFAWWYTSRRQKAQARFQSPQPEPPEPQMNQPTVFASRKSA